MNTPEREKFERLVHDLAMQAFNADETFENASKDPDFQLVCKFAELLQQAALATRNEEVKELEAEIERLQAQVAQMQEQHSNWIHSDIVREQENLHLREVIKIVEDVLRYRVNPHGHTAMIKISNTNAWTRALKSIEAIDKIPQNYIKRMELKARIDELSNYDHYHTSIARQLKELRAQLAELEGEKNG